MISHYYELASCYNDLVSRYYELASRYNELVARYYELVSRYNELVSRYTDLVSRYFEDLFFFSFFENVLVGFRIIQSKLNAYFNFHDFLRPFNYHYLNAPFYFSKKKLCRSRFCSVYYQ